MGSRLSEGQTWIKLTSVLCLQVILMVIVKLDLVFNLSGEFGELYVALYLSSCALPGQQVRKVYGSG